MRVQLVCNGTAPEGNLMADAAGLVLTTRLPDPARSEGRARAGDTVYHEPDLGTGILSRRGDGDRSRDAGISGSQTLHGVGG